MPTIEVHGLRELQTLAANQSRELSLELRKGLRSVAERMKRDVESLAQTKISHMSLKDTSKKWWKMRIGVSRNLVYIAPKERGIKGRGDLPGRRPRFADLMQEKAMQPALAANSAFVRSKVDEVLTRFVEDWNRS